MTVKVSKEEFQNHVGDNFKVDDSIDVHHEGVSVLKGKVLSFDGVDYLIKLESIFKK